jgi:hypothetical protein
MAPAVRVKSMPRMIVEAIFRGNERADHIGRNLL